MKNILNKIGRRLLQRSLRLALLFNFALCIFNCSAQVSPTSLFVVTNIPLVAAASVATNGFTSQMLPLTKNCALAFAAQFYTTNSIPGVTVTVGGSFSIDTTNFGLAPFTLSGLAPSNAPAWQQAGTNLTTPVIISTNWSQNTLSGYAAVMLNVFTNSASTTSVFNAGCKFSRPTLNTQTY